MKNQNDNSTDQFSANTNDMSYIPKAHVQFLEQSGIVIVPIDFMDSNEDILTLLKEVNGVYVCGDSHRAISNDKYQDAFNTILKFVVKSNKKDHEYFPMFMMGKSTHTFIKILGLSDSNLHNMKSFRNSKVNIELIKNHNDTFLLH